MDEKFIKTQQILIKLVTRSPTRAKKSPDYSWHAEPDFICQIEINIWTLCILIGPNPRGSEYRRFLYMAQIIFTISKIIQTWYFENLLNISGFDDIHNLTQRTKVIRGEQRKERTIILISINWNNAFNPF